MNRLKQHYWLFFILLIVSSKVKGTSISHLTFLSNTPKDTTPLGNTVLAPCSSRPAGLNCTNAPLLCPSEFPYCGTLPLENPFPPTGFGSIENYHLFKFEAGSPSITFSVETSNCTYGKAGNGQGVQIRVFEFNNCNTYTVKYSRHALPIPQNASDTVQLEELTPGNYYYFMIDGQRGDVCDYVVSVQSGKIGGAPQIIPSDINGVSAVCANTSGLSFSVPSYTGAIDYTWKVDAGATITSLQGTPSVNVNWGSTSGNICVKVKTGCSETDWICKEVAILDINPKITKTNDLSCGINSADLIASSTFSPNNANVSYEWFDASNTSIGTGLKITITTPGTYTLKAKVSAGGSICEKTTSTTVSSTTNPNRPELQGDVLACENKAINYNIVNPQTGIDKYNWILTNGTLNSGQNTPSVFVTWNAGAASKICVTAENKCGISDTTCLDVTVNKKPSTVTIIGNTKPCSGTTSSYSTSLNEAGITYTWSVPTGATIKKGQGTNSIEVDWGTATGGNLCVTPSNLCYSATPACTPITIKSSAPYSITIIGSNTNCPSAKAIYTVEAKPEYSTYNWKIPAIGTITKTNNKDTIEVQWNSTGTGNICLEIENECGIKANHCISVEVKEGIDSLTITGPKEVCAGDIATFTCQKDPDAVSYIWFATGGATILSGRGSNSISVRIGSTAGTITVSPVGGCAANKSSLNFNIKKAPDAPSAITGKKIVCTGDIETYTAQPVLGIKRYHWKLPTGATIVGSDSTAEVIIQWTSGSGGTLGVTTQGDCTESSIASLSVTVNAYPTPNAGKDEIICGRQTTLKGTASTTQSVWTVLSKPSGSNITLSDITNPKSAISVSQAGKYILTFTETNGSCKTIDTLTLTFKDAPQLTLLSDVCNTDGTAFNIQVNINSFDSPFTFTGSHNGSISGNLFTSNPIPDRSNFTLVVKDANGCLSDTLKGQKTCPCTTQSAELKDEAYVVCYGAKSNIIFQKLPVTDSNDGAEFVLHSGSKNTIGTIIQKNSTGEFSFDPNTMQYNTTYFIHHRAGNLVNGNISPTDRCYALSNGVTVQFKNKVSIGLMGDTTICANSNALIYVKTADLGVFKINYTNQTQIFSVNSVKNGSTIRVSPALNTIYSITQATDVLGCKAEIVESAKINIRPKPTGSAGIDQSLCEFSGVLSGVVPPQYKTTWRTTSGATITSPTSLITSVKGLTNGRNIFTLTIRDSICPTSQIIDTVIITVPVIPKSVNVSLEMYAGDTLVTNVAEEAPAGTYSVTRLDNPAQGRFDLFSNGRFSYIADPKYIGVVRFRFMICSELCTGICDTGEVRILIKQKPDTTKTPEIMVPNGITPNDDGKNDALIIDNLNKYPSNELIIFNRWGDILYKAKPYANNWEGTNQSGQPLPEGTYYYLLRLNINDGKILRGDITVLR